LIAGKRRRGQISVLYKNNIEKRAVVRPRIEYKKIKYSK
jgi:hypothetical protein